MGLNVQLVEDGSLTSIVEANDDDFKFLIALPEAPEARKPRAL